jgi:hypothetical protein
MKCPHCQQYSLTYDFLRNGWWCHVYNGFVPDEHMSTPDMWRHMPILPRRRAL